MFSISREYFINNRVDSTASTVTQHPDDIFSQVLSLTLLFSLKPENKTQNQPQESFLLIPSEPSVPLPHIALFLLRMNFIFNDKQVCHHNNICFKKTKIYDKRQQKPKFWILLFSEDVCIFMDYAVLSHKTLSNVRDVLLNIAQINVWDFLILH